MNKPTQSERCERLVRRFGDACSWQSSSDKAGSLTREPKETKCVAWLLSFGAVPLGMRVSQKKTPLSYRQLCPLAPLSFTP